MKFSVIKSYAKINLSLNVIKKLPSKLHKIESLVSFLKLHDLIYLRKAKFNKHKISFTGKFSKNIRKNNTISNLLKILDGMNLLNGQKFEIKIIKNIPQKSGMGGGSMNAASLIKYFIKKKIIKINNKKLKDLVNSVGSDVVLGLEKKNTVFCLGSKLIRFENKLNYHVLIVKPDFGCSTKFIFSKVKYFSKQKYVNPKKLLFNNENLVKSINSLEPIAFKKYPKLDSIKTYINKLSNIIFVRMTGSGSSIVAYFHSKKHADIALREFKKKFNNYWCITSKTI